MADTLYTNDTQPEHINAWTWSNHYVPTPLPDSIRLDYIVSVHYFEYASDFYFPGEAHDFWEFLFVDKGEIEVTAGKTKYHMQKGDIIFHKPMEFHNLWANGVTAPNLVVASFSSASPAVRFFENKVLRLGDVGRELLGRVVREARTVYSFPLDDPKMFQLERRAEVPFGAEQIIRQSLEQMLIELVRANQPPETGAEAHPVKVVSGISQRGTQESLDRIVQYLEDHVQESLTLDDICRDNLIGRSYLQKIFREKFGGGVMEYFSDLKIQAAKEEIRKGARNFTEIAHELGFASIHYFSRRFKKLTGMTPSEYASSVKGLSERVKPNR